MAEQPVDPETQDADDVGPGTQPVDAMVDSSSQSRPLATQAIFRPDFDSDDDDAALRSADTTPRRHGLRCDGWAVDS
jgi:serine/threonine-protein kinase PknG